MPVVATFSTHIYGDYWLGNQVVLEKYPNAKIYASNKMLSRLKHGDGDAWIDIMHNFTGGGSNGTKVTYPTNTLQHLDEIVIAGEKFVIHAPFKKSHTNTDLIISHPKSGIVFIG